MKADSLGCFPMNLKDSTAQASAEYREMKGENKDPDNQANRSSRRALMKEI